jgi:hypothetical protein
MTPPYQFVYLDIQELWPTSDETLAQEIARVTPASYGLKGAPELPPVPPNRPPPSVHELVDMLTPARHSADLPPQDLVLCRLRRN